MRQVFCRSRFIRAVRGERQRKRAGQGVAERRSVKRLVRQERKCSIGCGKPARKAEPAELFHAETVEAAGDMSAGALQDGDAECIALCA